MQVAAPPAPRGQPVGEERAALPPPQEGGGWRAEGEAGVVETAAWTAGFPSLDGETAWDHTAHRGRENALPASTFSLLSTWPLQWGPQEVGWNETKWAERKWL